MLLATAPAPAISTAPPVCTPDRELVLRIRGGPPDGVAGNAVDVDYAAPAGAAGATEKKSIVRGASIASRILDFVSQDAIVSICEQMNAAISEILDLQALDGTVPARDAQSFARSRVVAVQNDTLDGVVSCPETLVGHVVGTGAGLAEAVNDDRRRYLRQGG